jgi:hypothetical protein
MILFILLAILFFSLFIFLQSLLYRSIVKKAIRNYIEPKLIEKSYSFIEYKWPGLLSNGDFEDDQITLAVTSKFGNSSNTFYADIYYKAGNETKKVTAKIDTSFLSIYKVSCSKEL